MHSILHTTIYATIHISANTANTTLYLLPFEPPRSPLSNDTTATLPLPPLLPPCHCHCRSSKKYSHLPHCHTATYYIPVSLSILPLPPSIYYHSNRSNLLFFLTPLPPCHCHPPLHSTLGRALLRILAHTLTFELVSILFRLFARHNWGLCHPATATLNALMCLPIILSASYGRFLVSAADSTLATVSMAVALRWVAVD
jgi:hypothetical protein